MKTALTQLLDYLHLDNEWEEINENLQIHDIIMYVDKLLKMVKNILILNLMETNNHDSITRINRRTY